MQSLESLDGGQSAPVDGINMPHSDGAHDTADTVSKEPNRNGTQNNGGSTQRQVVEEILSGENHDTGGSIRGRCRRDGTDSVLLERPRPGVDKMDGGYPLGTVALATFRPPSSLELVSAWQEGGPCLTEEVGDKNDKRA